MLNNSQLCITEPNDEEELPKIRRMSQFTHRENEWKKDKAVLEQKIHLLELQLEDYKQRESNQKKLNETISSAMSDLNSSKQNKYMSEFQKSMDSQQKELQANRNKLAEQLSKLEIQNREQQEQLQEKDQQLREQELQNQRQFIQYDHRINGLEQDKATLNQEIGRLKEMQQKLEEGNKNKEQNSRVNNEQELQKLKDLHMKDLQEKQLDYEQKYQQLAQLYEKEKEQLNQRLNKCQNTIKKYQTHIESNADIISIQQKHDEQIQQLKQEQHEEQVQSQYDKKMLNKQIDDLQTLLKSYQYKQMSQERSNNNNNNNNNRDSVINDPHHNNMLNQYYQGSTSKKQSVDYYKIRQSLLSQESPVQCKSFHIGAPEIRSTLNLGRQSLAGQSVVMQSNNYKPNQSFEKIPRQYHNNNNDTMPIPIEDFNIIKSKKMKSQSTNSLPTTNPHMVSYLQDASLIQNIKDESFQFDSNKEQINLKHSISNQQTTRGQDAIDPQCRSYSQQGAKSSASNLSKILMQAEPHQKSLLSTKTNNTSFNSKAKVPTFSQQQLTSLRNSQQFTNQPSSTTLRVNDNHLNHIQSIKARYTNQEDYKQTDVSIIKQNKENQQPSKSVYINNEIKFLIGKLLHAKGKLTNELENMEKQGQKSFRYSRRQDY